MNTLGTIALGAGFQDGFNPCMLMTCAVFIVWGIWISKYFSRIARWRLFFILIYGAGTIIFNFSPLSILIFKKPLIFGAKVIYFILGLGSFMAGVLFIKDYFYSGATHRNPNSGGWPQILLVIFITFILALFLSALGTLWPINNYVALLGIGGLVNGTAKQIMMFLVLYTVAGIWPLWFLWAFLGIKNIRPALIKIVCASVFFIASSSVILIFK